MLSYFLILTADVYLMKLCYDEKVILLVSFAAQQIQTMGLRFPVHYLSLNSLWVISASKLYFLSKHNNLMIFCVFLYECLFLIVAY